MLICFELFVSSTLVYLSVEFFWRRDCLNIYSFILIERKRRRGAGKRVAAAPKHLWATRAPNAEAGGWLDELQSGARKAQKKVESLQSGGQPREPKDNKVCSQCHPSTSKENQKVAGQNAEQQIIVPPVVVVPSASGNFGDGNIFLGKSL